jgi:hypothetical protein
MSESGGFCIGVYSITLMENQPGDYEALMHRMDEVADESRELWHGIGESPEWAVQEAVNGWKKWRQQFIEEL